MQSSRQRRRLSRAAFVRLFAMRRRAPQALAEQRERLVTSDELTSLRLAR